MKDLDLLGPDADGTHLTLADADGRRYRLRITEPLRASLRPGSQRPGPASPGTSRASAGTMRPKEIQSLLRSGATAADVAERAGADLARIESYAAPIEAERAYIAQRAQGLRVGHTSDAPNLGDLVVDRLAARHVEANDITWDAVRHDGHPWEVVVTFPIGESVHEARWSIDLARHVLHATDDESRWLSETDIGSGGRRRPLPGTGIFTRADAPSRTQEAAEDREALLARLASSRGTRQEIAEPDAMDPDEIAALRSLGVQVGTGPDGSEAEQATASTDPSDIARWHDLPGAHPAHSHAHEAPDAAVLSLADRAQRSAPVVEAEAVETVPAQTEPTELVTTDPEIVEAEIVGPEPVEAEVAEAIEVIEIDGDEDVTAAPVADLTAPRTAVLPEETSRPDEPIETPEPVEPIEAAEPVERIEASGPTASIEASGSADDGALDVRVPSVPAKRKGTRRSVPSWDEIVFGTRSD